MYLKIGHRGAPGYEPENTIKSFEKAISMGVDMIELDVHLCKSGEVIIIHDKKVNRTTNGKGFVKKKSLDKLKILDAGKGEKIPTLQEVLDFVNKRVKVNIELKGSGTTEAVLKIVEKNITKNKWKYSQFIISSFDSKKIKKLSKLNKDLQLGVLSKKGHKFLFRKAKEIKAYSIHLHLKQANKKIIKKIQQEGFKVFLYTIKTEKDAKKAKSLLPNGIICDSPNLI